MTDTRHTISGSLLLASILLLAGSAHGALKPLEQAYELALGTVSLPGNESGQLLLRRCAGCKPESLRVNPATRYFVRPSKAPVSLREARQAAVKAGANPDALVFVYYEPTTRTVRRLVLDPGP